MNLQEYNKHIYEELSRKNTHFQVGFFNSNKILFVGQNPGNPFTKERADSIQSLDKFKTFEERENFYTEDWKSSLFGKFLENLIDGRWDEVSFTNFVKVPTLRNAVPSRELIVKFEGVLKRQIEFLDPKCVVCFGRVAGSVFYLRNFYEIVHVDGREFVMFYHPAFLRYETTERAASEVAKMKEYISRKL